MTRLAILLLSLVLSSTPMWGAAKQHCDADSALLGLDVDVTAFFRNNEFASPLITGYTLPGFRFSAAATYRPDFPIELDAGVYALRFWGADHYPNLAYRDIAYWNGTGRSTPGFHLLPLLRASMSTSWGLQLTLGTLRCERHNLPEPLYASELDLTADPAAGVQASWRGSRAFIDAWIDWQSFIYRGDTHPEAFLFGLSGYFDITRTTAPLRLRANGAVVVQHRGGEIDTIVTNSVQTLMNATTGMELSHNFGTAARPRTLALQASYMLYRQVVGNLWPYKSGKAVWLQAAATLGSLDLRAALMRSDKFVPLLGLPLWGSLGQTKAGDFRQIDRVTTVMGRVAYTRNFAREFSMTAYAEAYIQPSLTDAEGTRFDSSTSWSAGLTMRFTPSFPLINKK